ncbi:uncharacterized mitochondrial protein AtMg00810-like [Solanum stenotomum]|uniref:uncharacterized mitochondrial protein AtMg00810-like n=1 Tax=Solanum stenotomum TaxID=172797 RepID=UPI0020D17FEB|nr:uncharacterized mitochondrial protein AtMg00810-like [Solanum stenotomum]
MWVEAMQAESSDLESHLAALAAKEHWHIHQMDLSNAFFEGDLFDEVYVNLPIGFQPPKGFTVEYDELSGTRKDDKLLTNPTLYMRLIGKLLYLNVTRPDISFATQTLSQFLHQPKQSHLNDALKVVRYIKSQTGLGVLLSSKSSKQLQVYCDSDWGACLHTRRSVTGFMVKLGGSLISWKSKKQGTISRSLDEPEYKSMASAVVEVVWLVKLFKELGAEVLTPVIIYSDSKSAIQITSNPVLHERTKKYIE